MKHKMVMAKVWALAKPNGRIVAYGNGAQWQLPIFQTKKEAIAWQRESLYRGDLKITRIKLVSV